MHAYKNLVKTDGYVKTFNNCIARNVHSGETSEVRLGGGLVLPDQKGVAEVVPEEQTFQPLINISFPKIVFLGEMNSGHSIFH